MLAKDIRVGCRSIECSQGFEKRVGLACLDWHLKLSAQEWDLSGAFLLVLPLHYWLDFMLMPVLWRSGKETLCSSQKSSSPSLPPLKPSQEWCTIQLPAILKSCSFVYWLKIHLHVRYVSKQKNRRRTFGRSLLHWKDWNWKRVQCCCFHGPPPKRKIDDNVL